MSLLQRAISISPAGADCERKEGKKNPFLIRICSFLLLLVLCLNLVPPAHAYSIVHIQASIDLATWEILTGVVRDEVGITACSPEWKRMEESDLTTLSNYAYNSLDLIDADKVASRDKKVANNGQNILAGIAQNAGFFEEDKRVLSFPTKQKSRNSSDSTDMESAMAANNAIVFDLNQAFKVYCEREGIAKKPDATAMLTAIKDFMNSTSPSGDFIEYYASASGNEKTKYRWKTEKYKNSSEMITWSMLIVEAFNNFSLEGDEAVDADNVFSSNPNQLTKAIVGFFGNALNDLRSILGLWSMDELMFNEGWRSGGYVGGIFPTSWEPTIWALFIFTEIIAAMILLVGIVMNVLKQAASTMNTIARIHAMSQIQDLLVCGIALVLLPVALRMIIAMSGNLVDIVSAMRPDSVTTGDPKTISEMVARFSSSNGTFGGIIAQCLFFGVQVYFNFFYALRALTTAILIIMAPMMVAMITISSSRKQTTMTWAKELLANILVQPIHTFCITVILLLPASSHGFDNLIALYAIIPFTSMVRSLFFGPAGGFVDQVAGKGAAVTNGAIAGAAMGAASRAGGGLLNFAKDKLGGGGSSSGEAGDSNDGSGSNDAGSNSGGTNTNLSNASAERNSGANGQGNSAAAGAAGGAAGGAAAGGGTSDGSGEAGGAGAASPIADAQNGSEAKERVKVERESKTLSTITFQNYFRLYNKLSGMTGTALTEEEEFGSIYKLDIIEIPTNLPVARQDNNDIVYKTEDAKYQSVIEQIKLCHAKGQPVLVGTVSIDKSERLSKLLKKEGIPHNVLNAKNHEQEAEIVAQAGKWGAVTVATNMAGRGTDIMLGGNAEFLAKTDLREMGYTDELIAEATGYAETVDEEILSVRKQFADCLQKYKKEIEGEAEKVRGAGGLFIIGTERHDSRRIDNQLRGRAGRQGDPGETRFYLSLEDDLIRLFGGDRITSLMEKMDIPDDMPIENKMLTKAIMNAQISVESRNFQARKSTLEYDDVMNKQREIVYSQRRQVLDGRDIRDVITGMIASIVSHTVQNGFSGQNHLDDEGYKSIMSNLEGLFFPKYAIKLTQEEIFRISAEDLTERITVKALETYDNKEREVTPPVMREVERVFMLRTVDEYWMEHIDAMQELRQGIRLRAYAQSNPVDAYKQESLTMFDEMIAAIQEDTVRRLYFFRVQKNVV